MSLQQKKNRVLETDFPIVKPHRSHSRERNSAAATIVVSTPPPQPPPAYSRSSSLLNSDWQYQSATGSPIQLTTQVVQQQHQPLLTAGRSGSLRKAYSESSSAADEAETEPLYKPRNNGSVSVVGGNGTIGSSSRKGQDDFAREKENKLRHRKHDEDSMSAGARCCFGFLILMAQILLNGVMALVLYWVVTYQANKDGAAFAWRSDPKIQFNFHPVLMVAGFIWCMGQSILFYRTCRCCRRIWNKLLHTMFHILAIPCIAVGFIAVLDSHNLRTDKDGNPAPIPNFYSLHSWMGLTTIGLFVMQFVVGFFSFLLLLCCESATASFRANLVPIHSTFGISTFVMAVATCCAGFTEKAFFSLSIAYSKWVPYLRDVYFNGTVALSGLSTIGPEYTKKMFEESLTINFIVAGLIGLVIVVPLIVNYPKFRYRPQRVVTVTHDRYG